MTAAHPAQFEPGPRVQMFEDHLQRGCQGHQAEKILKENSPKTNKTN